VIGLDRMTAELVTLAYDKHADMAVLGNLRPQASLRDVMATYHPDLVVAAESEVGDLDEVLFDNPRVILLVVEARGTGMSLVRLRAHREPFGELAEDTLVAAARAALAWPA
jgi:hypothetical protein